jgi:hypothetical protein
MLETLFENKFEDWGATLNEESFDKVNFTVMGEGGHLVNFTVVERGENDFKIDVDIEKQGTSFHFYRKAHQVIPFIEKIAGV